MFFRLCEEETVIADRLAPFVNETYNHPSISFGTRL